MEPSLPTSQPSLNPLAFLRGPLGDEEGESTDTMEVAPPPKVSSYPQRPLL